MTKTQARDPTTPAGPSRPPWIPAGASCRPGPGFQVIPSHDSIHPRDVSLYSKKNTVISSCCGWSQVPLTPNGIFLIFVLISQVNAMCIGSMGSGSSLVEQSMFWSVKIKITSGTGSKKTTKIFNCSLPESGTIWLYNGGINLDPSASDFRLLYCPSQIRGANKHTLRRRVANIGYCFSPIAIGFGACPRVSPRMGTTSPTGCFCSSPRPRPVVLRASRTDIPRVVIISSRMSSPV